MKYARIIDNTVIEVIDFNPKGKYPKEIEKEFIKCPEYVQNGYMYVGGEWIECSNNVVNISDNNDIVSVQTELNEIKELLRNNQEKLEQTSNFINTLIANYEKL